jgi:hypothetical protein
MKAAGEYEEVTFCADYSALPVAASMRRPVAVKCCSHKTSLLPQANRGMRKGDFSGAL